MTTIDDEEFFEQLLYVQPNGSKGGRFLPLEDLKELIVILKIALHKLYWSHPLFDGSSDFKDKAAMPSLFDLQVTHLYINVLLFLFRTLQGRL